MADIYSIFLTGASRGIGLEFVKQLLSGNAVKVQILIASCRSPETATVLKMVTHWELRFVSVLLLLLGTFMVTAKHSNPIWSWRCQNEKCTKILAESINATGGEKVMSKNVCKLICGKYGPLWPKPNSPDGRILIDTSTLVPINPYKISFQSVEILPSETKELLEKLAQLFSRNVFLNLKDEARSMTAATGKNLAVKVMIENPQTITFTQDVVESYTLTVLYDERDNAQVTAVISAPTYIGVKHAAETLSQLIVYDDLNQQLLLPREALIEDKPAYSYRGVLLDTVRNYYSVGSIKRLLDAMSASKLNTFHWHITDSQSFPMEIKSLPRLTMYGAYDANKVYTHEDIISVVNYARVRGIRVVPELDSPAHVGEGWPFLAKPGENVNDYVVCYRAEPYCHFCAEPPCGQLNPTSEKVYDTLSAIYKEMHSLFDSDLFHLGGDEVNMNCWNSTESIVQWMSKKNLTRSDDDFHKLWNIFLQESVKRLELVNKRTQKLVLWTSTLTTEARIKQFLDPQKYIIQIWTNATDETIASLVKLGFSVILSNYDALYMDCGFGAWIGEGNNWCSPYIPWQKLYNNDPLKILEDLHVDVTPNIQKLFLGAEAALWSEQANEANMDSRLWPRVAAMAERLWSNPSEGWEAAVNRLYFHQERLVQRGIQADASEPMWCHDNEGACSSK